MGGFEEEIRVILGICKYLPWRLGGNAEVEAALLTVIKLGGPIELWWIR